jgi:hypothetical protein
VPSTTYAASGCRSSAVGTRSARTWPSLGVTPVTARLIVGWDTPKASPISTWTRLRRAYVNATTTDLNRPSLGGQNRFSSSTETR